MLILSLGAMSIIANSTEIKSSKATSIVLTIFSARDQKMRSENIFIENGKVKVNGAWLSPQEVIVNSEHIKKISEFKTESRGSTCEVGHFEHILKNDKLVKKEIGCLESARFKELSLSFKALAQDPILTKEKEKN